jgi:hypothetical protein
LVISARDGEHLLLAAGELIAEIAPPLGEPRKQIIDRREIPAAGASSDVEVFLHRQRGENLALLRHPADAGESAAVRRLPRDVFTAPSDAAARDLRIAHDGEHQR